MRREIAEKWFVAVLIGIQVLVLFLFACQKKGYFIDEIYSWGLSNGYYKPFITSYDTIFEHWLNGEEFQDYMTVQQGERFSYASVYDNQTQDVHPPLYYMAMHTICSFMPDYYNKWQGILLNVFFYMGCLVMIFLTARILFQSDRKALAAMAVWGFSPGGLSTGIYIRMYMMMTFFTMVSVYLHVRLIKEGQKAKILFGICLATFLGLLTQYYFVFMAFFLSAAYVLWKIWNKKWKEAIIYSAALLGSVGLMVLVYPACILQLTRTDEFVANETRNNFANGGVMVRNLISYISDINLDFFAGRIREAAMIAVLVMAFFLWRKTQLFKKQRQISDTLQDNSHRIFPVTANLLKQLHLVNLESGDSIALVLLAVWILSFLAVSMVAVVTGVRYIYNLYPLFSILAVWGTVKFTEWGIGKGRISNKMQMTFLILAGFLFFRGYQSGYVRYLYPENQKRVELSEQYQDLYCLYIDNYENAPLTQDLVELSKFKGVYVMPQERIWQVQEILRGKDQSNGLIIYVDTNEFWSSGYDGQKVMEQLQAELGAEDFQYLYGNELSETYLLKGGLLAVN